MSMDRAGSDVTVIGAGIVGVTVAYELARAGASVHLVDKGEVAGLQSSRNWGFVRRQGCDPVEVALVQHSSQVWDRMAEEIGPELTLVKKGLVNLATTEAELARYRDWLARSGGSAAFGSQIIDPLEVRQMLPGVEGEWVGGLYTPTDGHADPRKASRAIAGAAEALGARISQGRTVQRILTRGGRATGVVTNAGTLESDHVVVCAGAWSDRLLAPLGVRVPVRWIRATAARTTPVAPVTDLAVSAPQVGFSQRADGSVIFGSAAWSDYDIALDTLGDLRLFLPNFARNRKMIRLHLNGVLWQSVARRVRLRASTEQAFDWPRMDDPPPNRRKIAMAYERLTEVVPAWAGSRIAAVWAGTVDVTPDAMPVIDSVEQVPGVVVATGMSSHGFGVGPGAGSAVAALVQGKPPAVNLTPFRVSRFREGRVRAHHHL